MEKGRNYTRRYEEYIYKKVKEVTVEQVSVTEELSAEKVQNIFSKQAQKKDWSKRLANARKIKFR